MTKGPDPVFDDYLDDMHGMIALPFPGRFKASAALFLLDPVAYDEQRTDWIDTQYHQALGHGQSDAYKRNLDRFEKLVRVVVRHRAIPFVGAGLSAACGFPTWIGFLRKVAKDSGLNKRRLDRLLKEGGYEQTADVLASTLGPQAFREAFDRAFARDITDGSGSVARDLLTICAGPVVTTNYDRVLERLANPPFSQLFHGRLPGDFCRLAREGERVLLKVHGELNVPESRILTKNDYDEAYGADAEPDMSRQLPRLLASMFRSHSFLFIGCSLDSDRTVRLLRTVAAEESIGGSMHHFAFLEGAEDEREDKGRERILTECGVFPIWYAHGQHDVVSALVWHLCRMCDESR